MSYVPVLTSEAVQTLASMIPSVHAVEYEIERRRCLWERRARPEQLLPREIRNHEKTFWLILAGRGWGKTRTGAEAVRYWHKSGEKYVNLIGATVDDARDIMIEGESGILAICPRWERPVYKRYERRLVWPNGAVSHVFTADEPERLRGKQHGKLWADEVCAWRYSESWDQAKFGLRLGQHSQAVVTTTPKPVALLKELIADPATHVTKGTTYDNRDNLSAAFYSAVIKAYEGTRLGRQELNAELLEDNPNALWKRDAIDAGRLQFAPADLRRVIVGVDPAVSSNVASNETGIVAAGAFMVGDVEHYAVLTDNSLVGTPTEWATVAVRTYSRLHADRLVGEVNNGGDLVEATVRAVKTEEYSGDNVSFKAVRASRGKTRRAEPVAALYEQGRVHHVGSLGKLEDQLCDWDPTIQDDKQASPDRMDALVWAITELARLTEKGSTGLIDYYAREVAKMKEQQRGN